MAIFQVELRNETVATVYVEADSKIAAVEDARELANSCDWEPVWDHYEINSVDEVTTAQVWGEYWSGGPDGDWVRPIS